MKKSGLISGTIILSVGALIAKIFSAIYRIVLTRILGSNGIGLYQLVFPLYSLCVVLTTAGIPLAISKIVANHKGCEKQVLNKSVKIVSIFALILALILTVSCKGLAILQGQREISICYLILAPTIVLSAISSVLRGYFQGKHNFVPSSLSSILEQLAKLICGLSLSLFLIQYGIFEAVVGAIISISISEILSFVVLLLFIKKNKNQSNKIKIKTNELLKDVLPITITNIILPISVFVDSILVVKLLETIFPHSVSVALYGIESGAVTSLINLPTLFSFSLASVIMPSLVDIKNKFNNQIKVQTALKIIYKMSCSDVRLCFKLHENFFLLFCKPFHFTKSFPQFILGSVPCLD